MAEYPVVSGHLTLTGNERDGHTFWVRVEGSSGGVTTCHGEYVTMPWLRAICDCGWEAETTFTIEENAHWEWLNHVTEATES